MVSFRESARHQKSDRRLFLFVHFARGAWIKQPRISVGLFYEHVVCFCWLYKYKGVDSFWIQQTLFIFSACSAAYTFVEHLIEGLQTSWHSGLPYAKIFLLFTFTLSPPAAFARARLLLISSGIWNCADGPRMNLAGVGHPDSGTRWCIPPICLPDHSEWLFSLFFSPNAR